MLGSGVVTRAAVCGGSRIFSGSFEVCVSVRMSADDIISSSDGGESRQRGEQAGSRGVAV